MKKNTYVKYCPNVYLAKSPEQHEKGEEIAVTTRRGDENVCIVHNLIYEKDGYYFYSITRADGLDSQKYAEKKANRYKGYAVNAEKRGDNWYEKSQEGKDFLSLAEPIKIGHHSEKRHRALIERNRNRMDNAMKEYRKIESYENKASYWEDRAKKIDLSMPESVDYFQFKLEEAKKRHAGLKSGEIEKLHDYDLAYTRKSVKDFEKKLEIAKKLWN